LLTRQPAPAGAELWLFRPLSSSSSHFRSASWQEIGPQPRRGPFAFPRHR
jgi:hypothetical protein